MEYLREKTTTNPTGFAYNEANFREFVKRFIRGPDLNNNKDLALVPPRTQRRDTLLEEVYRTFPPSRFSPRRNYTEAGLLY